MQIHTLPEYDLKKKVKAWWEIISRAKSRKGFTGN